MARASLNVYRGQVYTDMGCKPCTGKPTPRRLSQLANQTPTRTLHFLCRPRGLRSFGGGTTCLCAKGARCVPGWIIATANASRVARAERRAPGRNLTAWPLCYPKRQITRERKSDFDRDLGITIARSVGMEPDRPFTFVS
jgi:hypothetical protein